MRKYSRIYIALIASGAMFQTFSASAAGNGSCTLEMMQGSDKVLENCTISLKSPGTDVHVIKANLTINNSSFSTANSGFYLIDSKLDIGKNSNFSFNGTNDIVGVYLRGNSTANLTDTTFTLTGAGSHGLRVENSSTANLTNTTLNFSNKNSNSTGLRVSNHSQANLKSVTLNLTGNNSGALVLSNSSKGDLQDSTLHLGGSKAVGTALFNSNITINNTTITLNDSDSKGLHLNSSNADVSNSRFNINNGYSSGIQLTNSSKANITNSTFIIEKSLYKADALSLENSSAKIINSNFTSGSYAPIISLTGNSTLDIEKSHLVAGNNYSSGAIFYFTKSGNKAHMTDSTVNSDVLASLHNGSGNLTLERSLISTRTLTSETGSNNSITITANNSSLAGGSVVQNGTTLDINLNNSNWIVRSGNNNNNGGMLTNSVTNLTLSNSSVRLSVPKAKDSFQTFTILGDLSGTGSFALNTDLANQQSDKIVVKGKDSGNFTLAISDSGNEPKAENGRVTLVETQQGMAKFSLKDRDYVDAGAYRYRLAKDGKNWILSNKQGEQSVPPAQPQPQPKPQPMPNPPVQPQPQPKPQPMPNPPVQPQPQPKPQPMPNPPVQPQPQPKPQPMPNPPVQPQPQPKPQPMPNPPVQPQPQPKPQPPVGPQLMLSEKTNALVSLRQAQLLQIEQGLAGIHQRLGELKQGENGNVWVRNVNQRTKLDALNTASNSRSSGFTQDYHGVQLGADKLITSNVRIGAFIGTANADIDFNGAYSTGKVKSRQAGLYATLLTDNGFYSDLVYTYDRLNAESGSTGKQSFSAHTVSNEIGKIYRFSNNWTVTPQLQAAFSRISGNNDVERLNSVYARAGLRIAKSFELADWTLQPYAEVNGVTSKNSSGQVKVNQYAFDVASAKGRLESALGANIAIGNHRFGIEGKTTHGSNLKQPFVAQAVYRYQW